MYRSPFRGSVAIASGRVTRNQLRGPRFRRLFQDVYIGADVHINHYLWCRAAALHAGEGAVLSGLSAALIWGVDRSPDRVEVTVARKHHLKASALMIVRSDLPDDDVCIRRGVTVTSAARTTFDLARRLPRTDAVIAVDAMMAKTAVTVADLRAYVEGNRGLHGIQQAAALVHVVEPLTESPMESVCRLTFFDAGLPRPVAQFIIILDGRFLARLDFAYPELRIGIEYEGDHHRDRVTFQRDVARYRALDDAGWVIVRVTADDVLRKPGELVERIRRLIAQRQQDPK